VKTINGIVFVDENITSNNEIIEVCMSDVILEDK